MCLAQLLSVITFFILVYYDFSLLLSIIGAVIAFLICLLIKTLWIK